MQLIDTSQAVRDEYKKRHDEIWPELQQALRDAGVGDYSIFLDEKTGVLFAVQKLASPVNTAKELPQLPIVQKWWKMMAPLMHINPDSSPVCNPLQEVFHLA